MREYDQPTPARTAAEIQKEFHSHLESIEFGSPDYRAFCDFFALNQQKYSRRIELKNLTRNLSPEEKLSEESQLRITETRIAMLENEIDHRKTSDIDYSKAYDRVENVMEKLRSAIRTELNYQVIDLINDPWKLTEVEDTYQDILVDDFRDVLYRFYH